MVGDYPISNSVWESVELSGFERVSDIIQILEDEQRWSFDYESRRFYRASATHRLDSPDIFGRPTAVHPVPSDSRQIMVVRLRFVRIQGSLTTGEISAGVVLTELVFAIPAGVESRFATVSERSFFEDRFAVVATTQAATYGGTERKTVSSGLQTTVIVGSLPGKRCRVDGNMEISAFVGADLNRSVVTVPIQYDSMRGIPYTVARFRAADMSTRVAWKGLNFEGQLGGDTLAVQVLVD